MKKTFMTLAMAAMAPLAPSLYAQTVCGVCPQGQTVCQQNQTVCAAGSAECLNGVEACPVMDGCAAGSCVFSTLNLSDDQKAQIRELNAGERKLRENLREECRASRRRNDSTLCAKRDGHMREYLGKIKSILTPEQYVQFLEQSYVNRPAQGRPALRGNACRQGAPVMHHREAKRHYDCPTQAKCPTQVKTK